VLESGGGTIPDVSTVIRLIPRYSYYCGWMELGSLRGILGILSGRASKLLLASRTSNVGHALWIRRQTTRRSQVVRIGYVRLNVSKKQVAVTF
jgi:hypothetical protein